MAGKSAAAHRSCGTISGLAIWLDGKSVEPAKELAADLSSGPHTLCFRIDRQHRDEELRLELEDVPDSPARAQFQSGK